MVTGISTQDADVARGRLSESLIRVAEGDRAALHLVYQLTSAKLFGICLRISNDREGAEDILQDVYVKVWRQAGRFDPKRASPISWLAAIARNAAIDWRRSLRGPITLPEEAAAEVVDPQISADQLIEQTEQSGRIFDCLDRLEERQSTAIRAAFFDGLTYAELADRLAVPLGTMKSWIRRGLLQLKTCLGDG